MFDLIEKNHLYSGRVILSVYIVISLFAAIFIAFDLKFCVYPNIFDMVPVIEIFCVIFHLFVIVNANLLLSLLY